MPADEEKGKVLTKLLPKRSFHLENAVSINAIIL